ncbi:hypothetical protein DDZ13_08300 [Coraliomargarita sinensis]|uniref:STAS/SEC14 domain-containing protein n=1 Tax=Coraliomargarita sinensis TaxID=2174842 RepID=A0A317ZF34_9BACT|nr:hypothetical protein [Coraliomargarita sinensis]PXA04036.1 hypothetical protein DDZ13_08300 [Coraliomargarita sinensis]
MKPKLKYDFKEDRSLWITLSGLIDAQTMERLTYADHEDERSVTAKYAIADLREADMREVTHRQIRHVAALDIGASRTNPHLRVAFVAADPVAVECCQYYISICTRLKIPWELAMFEHVEEALGWCRQVRSVG